MRWGMRQTRPASSARRSAKVQRGDRACAVGCAVHRAVVDDDQFAITAALHVALDGVGAKIEGEIEGQQGIFGRMAARAPMGIADYLSPLTHRCPALSPGPSPEEGGEPRRAGLTCAPMVAH